TRTLAFQCRPTHILISFSANHEHGWSTRANVPVQFRTMKAKLKAYIESNGWYLRKTRGLSPGVDCFHELRYRMDAKLKTVLDVGAHHGETTFAVLERFPHAVVHAF